MPTWSCRLAPTLLVGVDDRDAEDLQEAGRADAGKLQKLRRVDRAGAEDDFAAGAGGLRAAVAEIFDADGAIAFEDDFGRQRIRLDADVLPLHGRAQEGAGGRHAAAVLGRDLVDADAFLGGAVEIRIEGQPGLLPGLEIARGHRMDGARAVGDMERSADAAPIVGAGLVVLDRLEGGRRSAKPQPGLPAAAQAS